MAVTRFNPIIWSAVLMESLKKSHVYAELFNRDYEGEIQAAGDTVKITSISRPTVSTYTRNADISYEELTDAQRSLSVDQEKYFAFSVDDVDKRQAKGNFVTEAMTEASYSVSDTVDQFCAGLYTQVQAANQVGTVAITTGDLAYTGLRKVALKLTEANVPSAGRVCVVPPWYHSLLLENTKFTSFANSNSTDPLLNGRVGRCCGMDIRESNNAPLVTGDDYLVLAGTTQAGTFASQIAQTEALRSELRFADRVRGLYVYGAKILRPDCMATLVASQT
jgi:N4-gp56 family major capsid protein